MDKSSKLENFQGIVSDLISDKNSLLYKKFLLFKIGSAWPEIAGNLANHCSPLRLDKTKLIVGVDSAPLANQLFMVKQELLKKVNSFLKGEYVFLDLKFVSEVRLATYPAREILKREEGEKITLKECPLCGVEIDSRKELCFTCQQEREQKIEKEIKKIILDAPWIKTKEMKVEGADDLTIDRVREDLAGLYYEKVRNGTANDKDKILAVLFYTGKKPDEISQELNDQVLAILANDERIKE